MRTKPKKPTRPYGHIAFSKDRRVTKRLFCLSDVKERQEQEALGRFVELFNQMGSSITISDVRQLPENDQDFSVKLNGNLLHIQVTELVERSFVFPTTEDEIRSKKWENLGIKQSGDKVFRIDFDKKNAALTEVIRQKLAKHYAKTIAVPLWMVVFSTTHYTTEYVKQGQLYASEGLANAQDYLAGLEGIVFDEIWFTDLQTRPVRVWPVLSEPSIREGHLTNRNSKPNQE